MVIQGKEVGVSFYAERKRNDRAAVIDITPCLSINFQGTTATTAQQCRPRTKTTA